MSSVLVTVLFSSEYVCCLSGILLKTTTSCWEKMSFFGGGVVRTFVKVPRLCENENSYRRFCFVLTVLCG